MGKTRVYFRIGQADIQYNKVDLELTFLDEAAWRLGYGTWTQVQFIRPDHMPVAGYFTSINSSLTLHDYFRQPIVKFDVMPLSWQEGQQGLGTFLAAHYLIHKDSRLWWNMWSVDDWDNYEPYLGPGGKYVRKKT